MRQLDLFYDRIPFTVEKNKISLVWDEHRIIIKKRPKHKGEILVYLDKVY